MRQNLPFSPLSLNFGQIITAFGHYGSHHLNHNNYFTLWHKN